MAETRAAARSGGESEVSHTSLVDSRLPAVQLGKGVPREPWAFVWEKRVAVAARMATDQLVLMIAIRVTTAVGVAT